MKPTLNKNLVSLKCVLFCFMSGVGCVYPFLPAHMLWLGLDKAEARLVSAVAPAVALLGPALLGPLIDRLSVGRGSGGGASGSSAQGSGRLLRVALALCLLLSALFFTLLLAVPRSERHEARRPRVVFLCDADGAYVMQEVCAEGMRCKHWQGEKSGVLAVGSCEYGCSDDNLTWLLQPFAPPTPAAPEAGAARAAGAEEEDEEDGEEAGFEAHPPHLCYRGQCLVYMAHQPRLRLPLSLLAPSPAASNASDASDASDAGWCTYRTGGPSQCLVPAEKLAGVERRESGCKPAVRCRVLDPYDEPDGVLADAQCRLVDGDPAATLGAYFALRLLADIWPTAALALLGAACVIATRETSLGRGDVGRQLAAGALGLALWPPLAGLAADAMPLRPFAVPFALHAAFMLLGALILLCDGSMPLSAPEWWWHTASGALALPMSAAKSFGAEAAAVCFVLTLLGTLFACSHAYLPWTVASLGGGMLHVGLLVSAFAAPAALLLCWAEALVDYVGHSNLFICAFVFYALQFTGYAYGSHVGWLFACALLEVLTVALVWAAGVLYFRHLVPRRFTAAGQALPVLAHFGLGRCLGALLGGLTAERLPQGLAVLALLLAALYLALYHLLLAPRCAARVAHPPQELLQACPTVDGQSAGKGLNGTGASNGSRSPLRVYHEERSRKGQFRY